MPCKSWLQLCIIHKPFYGSLIRSVCVYAKNTAAFSTSSSDSVVSGGGKSPLLHRSLSEPYGGGDIYWAIRRKCFYAGHRALRLMNARFMNTDVIRMIYAGVPKKSYDPKINQFYTFMDNEEWTGSGGRFWIDVSNSILFPLYIAFWLYFFTYRFFYNNKHNVFARWANKDED
ncbi:hypothetical protein BmR1_04g05435 [Babesia microti strain RI]|uniref:Uncharacterized protein n=1 Tax=Babesia microti (strain RI) TaxID=1133968 RepID=I7JCL3_BABMR|nr:hypothetical protein BmR1_04g05435 [Babesia microti strain RI]CCF75285.1 hypothetical protein BmR1_04g05435 [Babesia microti strain RI]|eukprot:XP_012649693.1 hypothetical protein BmR1_04g05435 [Babesia microti strain RI]